MPVLAPARGERARLESLLGDVWSREILPFPGMTARARSEHLVRTSASTVMRKLSVASITSTFAKKSGSLTQRSKAADGADEASNGSGCRRRVWRGSTDEAEVVDEGERASTVRRTKKTRTARCLGIQSAAASGSDDIARAASTSTPRRAGTGKGKRDGEESIALRPSSANSLRLSRSTRSDKGNRRRMEKENKALEAEEKLPTQAWRSKLGVTRNQGGNHSFRNLFR
ncbi:hypothetical protein DCS_07981 [Drechmeria coniospora]|uniref:Uncharacterized protein n=1 Tax=Drechmeria coniospora TaxID=98403 RepID=A0A151GG24_DRECN|nr:hypothetical protein DCS_07981 [Drechmeria coniospora]KYK56016.1 hypothetical protein DCS_07981 [Drechmeria coniospora]